MYCKLDQTSLNRLCAMQMVNISESKSQLSAIIKNIEEYNEEIIIGRAGKPIAKIIKYQPLQLSKRLNIYNNKIEVAADFDEWPADIALSLGIRE